MKQQIAQKLEQAFSQYGFAEPSVSQLQRYCGVSLRTLYKYYSSKEEMIIAALTFRHQRYMELLATRAESEGMTGIKCVFQELESWMTHHAPHGCMSTLAVASFPDNQTIAQVVNSHKLDVRAFLVQRVGDERRGEQLFLLHEGVTATWPVLGKQALSTANDMINALVR